MHNPAGGRKYRSACEHIRFLDAADHLAPALRTLCYVLVYTSCRMSEALALTADPIDDERLTIAIRTLKRRRTVFRIVPVPQAMVDMLRLLPLAADGRLWSMHRGTAWRLVKATMHRAGVTGPIACPKGLRHGFGIYAAGHNMPTNFIQRWMRHASPTPTAVYLDAVGIEERLFASRVW